MHFPVRGGVLFRKTGDVKAVDGVSFSIGTGETLGLVGESGCGKSTVGKAVVRLLKPTAGRIEFMGRDITHLSQRALRPMRQDMQMVFQDPVESLDARLSVQELLAEPLVIHGVGTRAERAAAGARAARQGADAALGGAPVSRSSSPAGSGSGSGSRGRWP